ncbi:MAG TPA: Z1 domain-containing protein [Bacteroidia bacterium]|nr:Z1 domain-containing protein [Bacteroidia bacterium]
MENKYVDIIIKIIANKVREHSVSNSLTPTFFANLFPEIQVSVVTGIKLFGYPEIDEVTLKNYFQTAKNQYLSLHPIDIDPGHSLNKKGFKTWLTVERKEQMKDSWNYSKRYFELLEKSGRSEKVVEETKNSSLKILGKMGDPKSNEAFYTKGLVVGNVQAGKTQNFNAVINRAIDAGYGLIIVLAGLMEDLRNQTQLRIESDVVGEGLDIDTDALVSKGVGKIYRFGKQVDSPISQVICVTSAKSDFKKSLLDADFTLSHTNILVCKNNVSVLRNLIVWLHDSLEGKEQHNIPLLVLDDEADNASLNNEGKKGREYASKTNGHIRALLALFKKKTYLGYTATPFANVLADRNEAPENNWVVKYKLRGQTEEKALPRVDNLFPDDFIELLNAPTNYVGAKQIFETIKQIDNKAELKIPLVEIVNDAVTHFPDRVFPQSDGTLVGVEKINSKSEWEERFGNYGTYLEFSDYRDYARLTRSSRAGDNFPISLPESIKESIMCFILSIAIRESRKPGMMNSAVYNPHHSMLIHISRYTLWQNRLKDLIDPYVKELESSLQLDDPSNPKSVYSEFEKIWYKYYANIVEHIQDYLPKGYDDEFIKPISFDAIKNKNLLRDAIKDVEVKAINSVTQDKLVYPKKSQKKYIAIGGNRLSRGFTLEGLSINYFVRSTDYSDALLQMGRWFGYRPGYLDCCKLFITQGSVDKYDLVTRTIEELETEFKKMEEKDRTPENFILRVKKHPGTLKITRPAILRDTIEVNWSYQDTLEQTTSFEIRKEKIESVWNQFKTNIAKKFTFKTKKNEDGTDAGFLVAQTDIRGIIELLKQPNNFGEETCNSMIKFIERCQEQKKLKNWTIAIKTTGRAKENEGKGKLRANESNLPIDITMTVRRGPGKEEAVKSFRDRFINDKKFGASGKSANIISAGLDMAVLLTKEQIKKAEREFIEGKKKDYKKKYPTETPEQIALRAQEVNIPERVYREKMSDEDGLLVIYVLDSYYVFLQERGKQDQEIASMIKDDDLNMEIPMIGYAIGFPPIDPDPGGTYLHGDYGIEEDEEINEEDSELPPDANEV